MKLHTLLLAFLAFAIAPIQAQSPRTETILPDGGKTEDQVAVESIDARRTRLLNFLESELRATYDAMNHEGKQQARLNLLGTNAVASLTEYAELRAWILARRPNANIPAPDPKVFVPQADGRVKYVAPPKPEIPVTPAP